MSSALGEGIPAPARINKTFAELVQGREVEYPVLATAVRNSAPAENPEIQWAVPGGDVWENHTQIFRFPYRGGTPEGSTSQGGDPNAPLALHNFLSAVENTLINGVPHIETGGLPIRLCGGYRHYLGRDLEPGDVLALRPLREPFLWEHSWKFSPLHGWYALDTYEYEWLAEVSLQVVPGR